MMGIEFFRQGTSHKVYQLFTFLGISQGVNAARARIDKLVLHHDEQVLLWKTGIEVRLNYKFLAWIFKIIFIIALYRFSLCV
jgi:hypothetical protein